MSNDRHYGDLPRRYKAIVWLVLLLVGFVYTGIPGALWSGLVNR